ncbi:APC family permease [Bifidobacterium dentium]|uniref:APC family permease n=1 Tax=Bifidobacterium dentium TaxID=1689 RepID=UPI0013BE26C3|nr:APC family permease [Bifidobacterium dentium]NEG40266.1 APC family permease [Bifidobacterium dentium]
MAQQDGASSGVPRETTLDRTLKLSDLITYGLIFMIPVAPVAFYGSQVGGAHGLVATAYVIGLVAMLFTAFSYIALSKLYPYAGSVYNFVRQGTGNGGVGFIAGWGIILDYLLLPSVTTLVGVSFLTQLVPQVPGWLWAVIIVAIIATISSLGVGILSKFSKAFLALQLVLIVWFVGATFLAVARGTVHFSAAAFYNPNDFSFSNVLSATGLVIVSFMGYDAISTLSEEAQEPRCNVPRAIIVSLVTVGLIFVLLTFLAGSVQPDYTQVDPDSGFLDILGIVGGRPLQVFASIVVVLSFSLASGEECVTSVSRVIYAIGRDGILPKTFGRLSAKFHTPVVATVTVAAITLLLSLTTNTDILGNMVSFGALFSFILLNLTVVWHLFVRNDDKSPKSVLKYLVSPLIGAAVSVWIFTGLGPLAWGVGAAWIAVGLAIIAVRTHGFTRHLADERNLAAYFA